MDQHRLPDEYLVPPKLKRTSRLTLPTAQWRRSDGALLVVRLDFPGGTFCGDAGSDVSFVAPGATYLRLARALTLCHSGRVVLWVRTHPDPPEGLWFEPKTRGGELLIAHESASISLHAWREVRRKLRFQPRRWSLPSAKDVAAADLDSTWELEKLGGQIYYDGKTTFLAQKTPGLNAMISFFWRLHEEWDEFGDLAPWYFAQEADSCRFRFYRWNSRNLELYRMQFIGLRPEGWRFPQEANESEGPGASAFDEAAPNP